MIIDTNKPSELFTVWEPDFIGKILGTGYMKFETDYGMCGLAKFISDTELDILAVVSLKPESGTFRKFINACKKEMETVNVLEVMNPILNDILYRYGFRQFNRSDEFGEIEGWKWLKPENE